MLTSYTTLLHGDVGELRQAILVTLERRERGWLAYSVGPALNPMAAAPLTQLSSPHLYVNTV